MTQRPALGRRGALFIIVIGLILAVLAAVSASSYLAGEAEKVAAPQRDAWVAARDIPAGTLLTRDDLAVARFPVTNEMAGFYLLAADPGRPPVGVVPIALRKGEPLVAGAVLPPELAESIAPVVPLTITVGGSSQPVVGALNIPLGRLVAPPPAFREGDHIDLWAQEATAAGLSRSLTQVLSDVEVIGFVGTRGAAEGVVIAVTRQQLEQFVTTSNAGAQMIATVRSSRR
ncbi:MAG: hypothetical protein HYU87_11780 [Chloroflexi bacterium]|nr:hypothetical protein [Chloroflexota bacterium]